jgi:hypothetical protein
MLSRALTPAVTAGEPRPPWPARAVLVPRRHWLLCGLLAAGLVLRMLAQAAYHPALIYVDTLKYLYGAAPGADPLGYRVLLKIVLLAGDLGTVALVQHLLGLAIGIVLYAVLLRRGVARWLAALAVAPVLLDAYQVQLEQTIMPDVCFEAVIVAGLAVLLWRPAVTVRAAVTAGLLLGASATVRQVGELLVLPAAGYLLAARDGGWRRAAGRSAVLAAAFLLPILCYCAVSSVRTGHFWLGRGQAVTGRVAAAADCATLRLPAAVRPLCPTPAQQARGADWLEHSGLSPLYSFRPGTRRAQLTEDLKAAVEHQQPGRVAAAILRDSVRLFAVTRGPAAGITPISRWQFQARYPTYYPWVSLGRGRAIVVGVQPPASERFRFRTLAPSYGGRAQVDRPVAMLLRAYQLDGGYTPGPLLAVLLAAGVAGSAAALAGRGSGARRQVALACLLLTASAATVLLASDVFEFSWRYQLPALVTIPPAGVLGIAALLSRRPPPPDS